ncbi:hypothetical protein B0T16DRAFT_516705 [Cercophora newfieldiana]|uniref:FAD-binding PCMH-type domain-containing protein n=1 Tax=Cercophora newfieldiana TaxID=92897 RepID=A0AA39XXH9_9PEZI|nr:hypothetical protein B0T16DRAFT_516705 [Cercophora newfieldiana]
MIPKCFGRVVLMAGVAITSLTVPNLQIVARDGTALEANQASIAAAAELVPSRVKAHSLQLTDAVVANLTAHRIPGASLFAFDAKPTTNAKCKLFPGDADWPSKPLWSIFNLLTGNALIETVPIGAVCYENSGYYSEPACKELLAGWTKSDTHVRDPTSVMSPLFQGETCHPARASANTTCTLGGFPSYVVNITNVAQIQLAINFARNAGLRLVVKNTGHDFLGKSCGAGALSIWTHHLNSVEFAKGYKTPSWEGSVFRVGSGVQGKDLFAAAEREGVTVVGGECGGVGTAGGYSMGGGHSPMGGLVGLGSDQVLSLDVVLPSGRFVTANETHERDLFWALRGGGGGTFGVVTAVVVKAHPKTPVSGVTFTVVSGKETNVTNELFWKVMYAYWRRFPGFAEKRSYGYSTVFPAAGEGYSWSMLPWLVPGMPLVEFKAMVKPLLEEWEEIGVKVEPKWFEYDSFYPAWKGHFPEEGVANSDLRVGSRLFPKGAWNVTSRRDAMFDAVRGIIEEGSALIQYNTKYEAQAGTPDSAANSHWRDAIWFAIVGVNWIGSGLPETEVARLNRRLTGDWMKRLREYGPGAYGNEGDVMEPDFGEAFFGRSYKRLLEIKRKVDPTDLFWAPTAVGSERWKVQDQRDWVTTQTGRLCRV